MSEKTNPRDAVIRFLCGAKYECDFAHWSEKVNKRNGRIKLAILDTDSPGKPTPPKLDGQPAPCLYGCETRKYRRVTNAMSEPPAEPFGRRRVVTCSGVLKRVTDAD